MSRKLLLKLLSLTAASLLIASVVETPSAKASNGAMKFVASSADSCFMGIHFWGYQMGPGSAQWMIEIIPGFDTSIQGGYFVYSWQLADADGIIGSGSYNSTTGQVTGDGGSNSGFEFTGSRAPIGNLSQMTFIASGSIYARGSTGSPCHESFTATTFNTSSSGGNWYYQ